MNDQERLIEGIRRAHQAGDENAVRILGTQLRQVQASEMRKPPEPSVTGGLARSALQGATFGFGDEGEATARALFDRDQGEDFSMAYRRHRDQIRGEMGKFEEAHPGLALGAEIAGGFAVPGVGLAKGAATAVRAGTTLPRLAARGALTGGAAGATYGAGKAKEVEDIPIQAAGGAMTGAVLGGTIAPAAEVGRRVVNKVVGAVAPARGAEKRISQAMARDETTPEQLQAALREAQLHGRPANVADVGGAAMKRELEVAAQSPGPAGHMVEKALGARNQKQLGRLSRDLVRGTGVGANDVLTAISKTQERRAAAARPLYERAMSFQAEMNDEIVDAWHHLTKTPLGKAALHKAKKLLNVQDFSKAPLMERIDAWKKAVDDITGSAKRSGENQLARRATEMKQGLVELVDEVNPAYKAARETWETESKYLASIKDGRGIFSRQTTSAELQQQFARMTDAEKEAYRIGAVDAIIARLRNDSAREPNLLKHIRSPEMMDKITAIMSPQQAERFRKKLAIEEEMFKTASQALKGSQTAQRTAAMQEQQKQLSWLGVVQDLVDLTTGGMRGLMIRKMPGVAGPVRDRMLSRQNAIIAQRLLGDDSAQLAAPRIPSGRSGLSMVPPGIIAAEDAMPSPGRR